MGSYKSLQNSSVVCVNGRKQNPGSETRTNSLIVGPHDPRSFGERSESLGHYIKEKGPYPPSPLPLHNQRSFEGDFIQPSINLFTIATNRNGNNSTIDTMAAPSATADQRGQTGRRRHVHDCAADHRPWPAAAPDGAIALRPLSCGAQDLIDHARRVANRNNRTPAQELAEHAFVGDYLLADVDGATDRHLRNLLWHWLEHVDRYCFGATLTAGRAPVVELSVGGEPPDGGAMTGGSTLTLVRGWPARRPVSMMTVYRSEHGARRPRAELLRTAVHGMTHAYLEVFYGRCPADGGDARLGGPAGDGHGDLFRAVFSAALQTVRQWHPDLAALGSGTRPRRPRRARLLEGAYVGLAREVPWLRQEWLEDGKYTRRGLLRWRKGPAVRDRYETYADFVRDRVPSYKVFIPAVAIPIIPLLAYIVYMLVHVVMAIADLYAPILARSLGKIAQFAGVEYLTLF